MVPRKTRKELAKFLTENGFPMSCSSLDKLCSPAINDGPPADGMWGRRPLYDPAAAIAWAEKRLRKLSSAA